MRQRGFLVFGVFLIAITLCASCSDGQACSKFKKKPSKWCSCGGSSTEKPIDGTVPVDDEPNDCDPYEPTVPDFSRPGQRISVTKCHEYIWEIKSRVTKQEQKRNCEHNKWRSHVLTKRDTNQISLESLFEKPIEPTIGEKMKIKYIMGGHDAFPKEFPHMGAVGWKSSYADRDWKFMCGSSLISPNFVLTAGHCISADGRDTTIADVRPQIVRFGVEDLIAQAADHSAEDRKIARIIPHPNYKSPLKYYDVALFELDRPIIFSKFVQPACLWHKDIDQVKNGTVTGWGVLDPRDHEGHPYLQAASLEIINLNHCDNLLGPYRNRRWQGLQDHQFCAGQMEGGVDACQGDSGGPFQTKIPLPPQVARSEGNMYYVVGLTSFGIGCGKKDVPGVYSKVSYFLDWIEQNVWG